MHCVRLLDSTEKQCCGLQNSHALPSAKNFLDARFFFLLLPKFKPSRGSKTMNVSTLDSKKKNHYEFILKIDQYATPLRILKHNT